MNAQMDLRIVTLCYGWPQAGSFIDATLAIPRGNPLLLRWDYGVALAWPRGFLPFAPVVKE